MTRALHKAGLERFVAEAIDAVPKMRAALDATVQRLSQKGDNEAAEPIRANYGSIMSHALYNGGLERYVDEAVQAVPRMRDALDAAAERLTQAGDNDSAKSIRANRGSIMYYALNQGGLEKYVDEVINTVPRIRAALDGAVERLTQEGKKEAAESIRANRGNIMYHALHLGGLEKYVDEAIDAVPRMRAALGTAVKRLTETGDNEAAESISTYSGSIISCALNLGGLEKYVDEAAQSVPRMLAAIDAAVERFTQAGDNATADTIRTNRRTIINRALGDGGLINFVRAEIEAITQSMRCPI